MTDAAIMEKAKAALSGMTAIREFCRSINLASSEASVINMIVSCGFPAKKIGGIWESDKEMIVEWRKKYINGEIAEKVFKPEEKICTPLLAGKKQNKKTRRVYK
ncbi:MAG: hypothetical protein M0R74_11135 [Dehalococcoidia bacterium]|jgi:hypothetical protein|nr:hypothetical protein [Dehalococcoidia bacterium]